MPALSAKESPVQMKSLAVTEVRVGDVLNRREAVTIHGKPVEIPDKERLDTYSSAGMRAARSAICTCSPSPGGTTMSRGRHP